MIRLKVDFIISGESLDPAAISQLLGLSPDEQQRRGDKHIGPSGKQYADHKVGLWLINSGLAEDGSFQDHVESLLKRISRSSAQFADLKRRGFDVYIFVGAYISKGNGAISLNADVMRRLSALGIDVDFDIYSDD
ncbi:MAG: DUF4279 domain-containing protein [Armatimonadota bacterium]